MLTTTPATTATTTPPPTTPGVVPEGVTIQGVPVVEHLTNLAALPPIGFRFFAVPPRVRGMGTFPARAFAIVG